MDWLEEYRAEEMEAEAMAIKIPKAVKSDEPLKVTCGLCGAKIGEKCTTPKGKARAHHRIRIDEATFRELGQWVEGLR